MTSWRLTGGAAPSTPEEWAQEFERYKKFPEYQANPDMTVQDFKRIYHIEWGHRWLGRITGVVFSVPLVYFAARGRIPRWLWPRLGAMFALGGTQGLVGWWMVKSGLSRETIVGDDPRVNPYRLSAHLGMAFATYSLLFWTGMDVLRRHAVSTALTPAGGKAIAAVRPMALLAASTFCACV